MILVTLFMLLVSIAVASMLVITIKVQRGLRSINYISGVRYGKVVQQLQDKHELHRFGFGQYFRRQYGELSIFSIAMNAIGTFPIMLLLLAPIIQQGGMGAGLFIYCGVGLVFIIILALIAQYLSAQPTAGGLYHAALREGGRWLGSIVGSLQLIGQLLLMLGYSVGFVYFLRLLLPETVSWLQQPNGMIFTVVLCLVAQLLIAGFKSTTYRLFHIGAFLIQGGGIALLILAVIIGWRTESYSGLHLFMTDAGVAGWFPSLTEMTPMNWGLMIALVGRFFIGGDVSSQHAEETLEPKVKIAWATLLSTSYSFMIGLMLMLILSMFYMNAAYTSNVSGGEMWLLHLVQSNSFIGYSLLILALISCWSSSSTLLHSASRSLMAMGRDGMIPFQHSLSMMNYIKQVPQRAYFGVVILALAFVVPLHYISAQQLLLHLTLLAVVSYCFLYVIIFFFVPLISRTAIWKMEGWERGIRFCGMLLLTMLASAAIACLPLMTLSVIIVPTLLLALYVVVYSIVIKGQSNKFFGHDNSASRDLFEMEGEMPLQ